MESPSRMFRTIWNEDEKYVCVKDYTEHLRRAVDMVEMMAGTSKNNSQAVIDTLETTIWHLEQL